MTTPIHPPSPPQMSGTPIPPGAAPPARRVGRQMNRDLRAIAVGGLTGSQGIELLLDLAARHSEATFVGLFQIQNDSLVSLANVGDMNINGAAVRTSDVAAACQASFDGDELTLRCLSNQQKLFVVAAPLPSSGPQWTALVAIVSPAADGLASRTAVIERVAAAIEHLRMTETVSQLDWEALSCAGAAELVSRVTTCESLLNAAFQLVNELRVFLECAQISLGICQRNEVGCRVKAVSGMSEFDLHAQPIVEMAAAMDECLVRKKTTVWPPLQAGDRHATLAHRHMTGPGRDEAVMTVPLILSDDRVIGVLFLAGRRGKIHHGRLQGALRAMAPHLATALDVRIRLEPGKLARLRKWIEGPQSGSHRRSIIAVCVVTTLLCPLIPWKYRVASDCQLQPVARRFIVAPFEGRLKSSLAKPGDSVTTGQLLARMDDRDLRWEVSSTIAELGVACTKRDRAMNDHDTGEAKLAELEMERAELKVKLLRNREQQLDITSPLDGVVLAGDLDDAVGAPVRVGQTLFEIAPLDPIRLEIDILEEDLPSVAVNQLVTARLDGYRGDAVCGSIMKIHPQAEVRESKNVFVGEVEVENAASNLLPGMSGSARVSTGWKPLGWIWFHKAWNHVRNWTGV